MQLSEKGAAFVAAHEGFVSRAYLCPAGVRTIGYGFTMGSAVFAAYWRRKHGRGLQAGDTITREEAGKLLRDLVDNEYGAAVNREIGTRVQHQFDGAGSVSFNCGTGSLKWKWAQLLRAKEVAASANRLRTTAVTANGRRLPGLVRRRDEEATLIETGRYALAHGVPRQSPSVSAASDAVRQYQKQLATLGYDVGAADGIAGPRTLAAVKAFQADQDLVIDGIVGPATRAALIRALDTKRGGQAAGAGTGAGAAGGGAAEGAAHTTDMLLSAAMWGAAALVAVGICILFLKYRGVITGRRVPT
ncbi:MAG: glycoside hydrolase family protein [Pararhodobacter sp.]